MSTAHAVPGKQPLYRSLFFQVVVALCLGILVGTLWPGAEAAR